MFKAAIIGASGYTGSELLRILSTHPTLKVELITAYTEAQKKLTELYPHFITVPHYQNLVFCHTSDAPSLIFERHSKGQAFDIVFMAMPHGESALLFPHFKDLNIKIIDLSSDFRIQNPTTYTSWYHTTHPCPEILPLWQYGLSELFREDLKRCQYVANPGCYATAVSLALTPLVATNLIEPEIVANCISGTSGAGKKPSSNLHFSHVYEDVSSYKIGRHQHSGEIEQTLNTISAKNNFSSSYYISMTAHLAPMARGIHATCSAKLSDTFFSIYKNPQKDLTALYETFYQKERFVRIAPEPPSTKSVRSSNFTLLHPVYDERTKRVIVVGVIDNLVKGAAGAAIQNANILLGIEEWTGLLQCGLYP
jgi:N-acetyl-gamma-glutamyl-phosphate reductase